MSEERKRKVKLWRCQNPECSEDQFARLKFDFESPDPVCPKCGADQRTVEGSGVIIARETLHYLVIDKAGKIPTRHGRRTIACDPTTSKLVGKFVSSWQAVTCPDCKASEVYQIHQEDEVVQDAMIVRPNVGG